MLTARELEIIDNYVGPRDTYFLKEVFVKHKEKSNILLYRSAKVRVEELVVGGKFPHWEAYTSWSKDEKIAKNFTFDNYIPEGLLGSVAKDMIKERNLYVEDNEKTSYFDDENPECYLDVIYKKIEKGQIVEQDYLDRITNVFYIIEGEYMGLDINKIYPQNPHKKEKEVLVDTSNMKIISIKKKENYYEVKIK